MRLLYASQSSFGGIKIGFLNVSIKRSPNVNKTFTQRFGNVIMLPKIDLVVKIGELLRFLSLSCFGKLFTSILSANLNKFLDAHTILEENQAGFADRLLNNGSYFCFACISRNCKIPEKEIVLFVY